MTYPPNHRILFLLQDFPLILHAHIQLSTDYYLAALDFKDFDDLLGYIKKNGTFPGSLMVSSHNNPKFQNKWDQILILSPLYDKQSFSKEPIDYDVKRIDFESTTTDIKLTIYNKLGKKSKTIAFPNPNHIRLEVK